MKKLLSILSILALSFASISCSSDEKTQSEETVIKPELYAIGTTPVHRSVISKQYLFTLDNIKNFNSKTREMVFVNFEPNSSLFPIYQRIEICTPNKVLLHITTFVSEVNSQLFTDLSLVSENGKFYLSDCYPRHIENNSDYVRENEAIKEAKQKRAAEWEEFLSVLKKHGKLIEE